MKPLPGIYISRPHCLLVFHLLSSLVCLFPCFFPKFNEHNFLCLELSYCRCLYFIISPSLFFLLKYHVYYGTCSVCCYPIMYHCLSLYFVLFLFCIMYYFETYIYLLFFIILILWGQSFCLLGHCYIFRFQIVLGTWQTFYKYGKSLSKIPSDAHIM